MKSLSLASLPSLNAQFHKYFPKATLQKLWHQVQPHKYHYQLHYTALVPCLFLAYLARISGLRDLTERHGPLLGTLNFSSLSPALGCPVMVALVHAMFDLLAPLGGPPPEGALIALDSMALTLPKTQRHRCKKINNKTVGGGVIWGFRITAAVGVCPVQVLRMVSGAWHDAGQMRTLELIARGPVYLMDRGFYALHLLERWLSQRVYFIVRVKTGEKLIYEPLRPCSAPRRVGALSLEWDGMAKLGGPRAKAHPVVRLLVARLASGEKLVLATNMWSWSATRILAAYKQRWQIELFHKLLKDALGLAHLYNFSQRGLEVQLYAALMLAVLLFLAMASESNQTRVVALMRQCLRLLRQRLGLGTPWRRNSCIRSRCKKRRSRAKAVNL